MRERWRRLEAAGVRSLARHTGATHRPHVTVASAPRSPGESVLALAAERWAPLLPLRLGVDGLILLGQRRAVVAELLDAGGEAAAARSALVAAWPDADDRPWVPHVSLATRVPHEQLAAVVAALGTRPPAGEHPPARTATALRWWDPEHARAVVVAGDG